jgi:hypothetical protein
MITRPGPSSLLVLTTHYYIRLAAASMYQYHHQPGTSSCYGEVTGGGGDAILPSPARPDAMLADGGAAFLQSPLPLPPSSYMLPPHCPSPLLVPPPPVPMSMWQSDEQQITRVAAPVRYSAEERRERIDKYRSKRNQRNFQKKITVSSSALAAMPCTFQFSSFLQLQYIL